MWEKKSACPGLKKRNMKIHQSVNLQHHPLKPSGLSASEGGASGRKEKMSNGNDNKTLADLPVYYMLHDEMLISWLMK